jgi:hypothetical protein
MAIPNKDYGITQTSKKMVTSQASIEMTPQMFEILSSQVYTDKISAVIRELICNARDSHVEAGTVKALEINLPSRLSPFFYVRDFGTGLSEDQVMSMYLKYGYSTKTGSNDAIGMMGIGSKSPFAYTDSFLVESYYNGRMTTYSIYKESGIPQVSKLKSSITSEPNGLKVRLAVANHDCTEFKDKLMAFSTFFDSELNVIGHKIEKQYKIVADHPDYMLIEGAGVRSLDKVPALSVTMGGVAYRISESYLNSHQQIRRGADRRLVLKFGIGDLTVAASRESLSEDKDAVQAIRDKVDIVVREHDKTLYAHAQGLKDPSEVIEYLQGNNLLNFSRERVEDPITKVHSTKLSCSGKSVTSKWTFDGLSPQEYLSQFKDTRFRVETSSTYYSKPSGYLLEDGSRSNRHLIMSNSRITFLLADETVGVVKVAQELNKRGRDTVYIVEKDQKAIVDRFYGNRVGYLKVSEQILLLFPKGVNPIVVKKSGLFDSNMKEIKSLTETQTGYYLPFTYDLSKATDKEFRKLSLQETRKLFLLMINAKLFDEGDLFIARKAGLPAVNKTKIKELTLAEIMVRFDKIVTKADKESFTYLSLHRSFNSLGLPFLDEFTKVVLPDYPCHNALQGIAPARTSGVKFLEGLGNGHRRVLCNSLMDLIRNEEMKCEREQEQFNEDHWITAFPKRQVTPALIKNAIGYYHYTKAVQTKTKKV